MKKIIISEKSERKLFENLINEASYEGDKEDIVYDFLSSYFMPKYVDSSNKYGVNTKDSRTRLFCKLDSNMQPTESLLDDKDLFELLQYRFQHILSNKNERDRLLWRVLNKWYNEKIRAAITTLQK